MKQLWQKIKDYFTASSQCRKIFFYGGVLAILCFILHVITQIDALELVAEFLLIVAIGASMVDTMEVRRDFLKQIQAWQYQHLQEIYDQQQAGQNVPVTPTFTEKEKKYISQKKWGYNGLIILKLALVLAILFLLFPK